MPGANTWNDSKCGTIIEKASELLSVGATVCAICGATAALAGAGLLDSRPHTSNGPGFLEMFAPGYKGTSFYVDEQSVADGNLITAGSTRGLAWANTAILKFCTAIIKEKGWVRELSKPATGANTKFKPFDKKTPLKSTISAGFWV